MKIKFKCEDCLKTMADMKRVGRGRTWNENFDSARSRGYADGKNTEINKPIASGRTAASSVKFLS